MPYGGRSEDAIYAYTLQAMEHMFERGCNLIVLACNTASATSLRRMQQTWLHGHYKGRNILGVVVPTLEAAIDCGYKKLGLIATNYSVRSNVYDEELRKINPSIEIIQKATPLLVPMIENDGLRWIDDVLRHYLEPLLEQEIECLILGCTHYIFLKDRIRAIVGKKVALLSQDEIVPKKLEDYLRRHPEYGNAIGRNGHTEFFVSDLTDNYKKAAADIYGGAVSVLKAAA